MSQVFATSVRDLTLSQECLAEPLHIAPGQTMTTSGRVVGIVLQNKLLENIGHREHKSFPSMKLNPLCKWDVKKCENWIGAKIKEH